MRDSRNEMIERVAKKIADEEPAFKPPRTDLQKKVKKKELPVRRRPTTATPSSTGT